MAHALEQPGPRMESEISGRTLSASTWLALPPRAHDRRTGWKGSSRMKGNFQVRFLGECGRGNPPALTRLSGDKPWRSRMRECGMRNGRRMSLRQTTQTTQRGGGVKTPGAKMYLWGSLK